jgi:hypothetical protein
VALHAAVLREADRVLLQPGGHGQQRVGAHQRHVAGQHQPAVRVVGGHAGGDRQAHA